MKITLLFLIVACLSQTDAQFSNLFIRFFCQRNNNHRICQFLTQTTQEPKTTTPRRTPPPPPRRPPPPPPPRRPTSTPRTRPPRGRTIASAASTQVCQQIGGRCTEGKFLADAFTTNLIAPARGGVKAPASSRGGGRSFPTSGSSSSGNSGGTTTNTGGSRAPGGSRVTGRRITTSGTSSGGSSAPGRGGGRALTAFTAAPCVTRNITDQRGNVIAGACVTPSSGGRSKRQTYRPRQSKRDLLFMMDESGSVGYYRFAKVKRIVSAIVRLLCRNLRIHPSYTRVAVTSFDSKVHYHVRLVSPRHQSRLDYDSNALANHIYDNIHYSARTQGHTCLIDALEHAYSVALDKQQGGRRGYRNVEQDIILISDGCENCVRPTQLAHARIQAITAFFIAEGIHVYVIGIGLRERCKETLSLLAQGGRCFHFFYLTNWDYIVDDFLFQLEHPPAGLCLDTFETAEGQCLNNFG